MTENENPNHEAHEKKSETITLTMYEQPDGSYYGKIGNIETPEGVIYPPETVQTTEDGEKSEES